MAISGSSPFRYLTKDGSLDSFKAITSTDYGEMQYGDIISQSLPLSASLSSDPYVAGQSRVKMTALKNTLNYYRTLSEHYAYSSSYGDKSTQAFRMISIPSIFYGSSIRKGSVSCKFYLTGTLIAELNDIRQNGELVQVGPTGSLGSGSVAGVVLYREGFLVLTGSWDLHASYTDNFNIYEPSSFYAPAWKYFFTTGSGNTCIVPSSSFGFSFEGINYIPTITALAHAHRGEMNHSNNPTYIKYNQIEKIPLTSSISYVESDTLEVKNIKKTNYSEEEPALEKTTYISKIGIYDEEGNLIAIAKVATPVRKRETDSYTFKLKLDI